MSREALLQELGSDQRSRLRAACDAATEVLREDPEFRHGLIDLLSRGEPRARFAAAFVLFHHERPTLRLLPPLLDALELDDGALRWSAARLLAALGRLHGEVLPVLLEAAAKSPSPTRRRMALYVLRELAPEAPQTHAVFLGALGDPDSSVQLAALASLVKLVATGPEGLEHALAVARDHADPRMRRVAAIVLPSLSAAHPARREEVVRVLEQLAGSEADPMLVRAAQLAHQALAG